MLGDCLELLLVIFSRSRLEAVSSPRDVDTRHHWRLVRRHVLVRVLVLGLETWARVGAPVAWAGWVHVAHGVRGTFQFFYISESWFIWESFQLSSRTTPEDLRVEIWSIWSVSSQISRGLRISFEAGLLILQGSPSSSERREETPFST